MDPDNDNEDNEFDISPEHAEIVQIEVTTENNSLTLNYMSIAYIT